MDNDARVRDRLCAEQRASVHSGLVLNTLVCEVHPTPPLSKSVSVYTDTGLDPVDVSGLSHCLSQRA